VRVCSNRSKACHDQQRLADNLKRALQNDPEAQKQGNAIKQLIEEAEAVARHLRANQLSQDLLNRQDRSYRAYWTRKRSINKRDTTEKTQGRDLHPTV
jgi:GNAT superfamily N-acetyltransferase